MNAKLLVAGLLLVAACSDADAPKRVSPNEAAPSSSLPPNHPSLDGAAPNAKDPHAGLNLNGAQAPAAQPFAQPTSVQAGSISFTAPAGWIAMPPSNQFRMLQFRLPRAANDSADAELAVSTPIGGTKQANIDRWIGELTQPDGKPSKDVAKISERKAGGFDVFEVDLSGTAGGGAPMMGGSANPRPGWRQIAAGIQRAGKDGPENVCFVKVSGPAATVAQWESSYRAFVDSVTGK